MIVYGAIAQGSPEWFAVRKGCITGSRFKDAREKLAKGGPSKSSTLYAMDVARERVGGTVAPKFQSFAMRQGTEQEADAIFAYENKTSRIVQKVGFIKSDCGKFGVSPDGLVGSDGVVEVKTIVSSDTLFTAVVGGDISEYIDQCNGYLWLLGRQWVDLVLWAPDLQDAGIGLNIIRINRDEEAIQALEDDLIEFSKRVDEFETELIGCMPF